MGQKGRRTDSVGENESSLLDAFLLVQERASGRQAASRQAKQAGK